MLSANTMIKLVYIPIKYHMTFQNHDYLHVSIL